MKNTKKVWVVCSVFESSPKDMVFWDVEGKYHIFNTKRDAVEYIDKQFFPAKAMGWRVKRATLITEI